MYSVSTKQRVDTTFPPRLTPDRASARRSAPQIYNLIFIPTTPNPNFLTSQNNNIPHTSRHIWNLLQFYIGSIPKYNLNDRRLYFHLSDCSTYTLQLKTVGLRLNNTHPTEISVGCDKNGQEKPLLRSLFIS